MSVELTCLVIQALWGFVLVMVEVTGKTRAAGTAWNMGNRDKDPDVPDWVLRARRALDNHKENFPLFLTAILVVHLTHEEDRTSAIAAIVYVVARAGHALLYIGGIKGARSLAHTVGLGALVVILSCLVL